MPELKKITQPELIETVKCHQNMLQKGAGGQRANLPFHYLVNEELSRFDLSMARFSRANLQHAILTPTNFTRATLFGTGLRVANRRQTNMTRCDLRGAHLSDAIMVNAYMCEGVIGWHDGNNPTYEHRNTDLSAAVAIRADFIGAKISGSFTTRPILPAPICQAPKSPIPLSGALI